MLRQSVIRPVATANRALMSRSFSVAAPRLGDGDAGAPRTGGQSQGYVSPALHSIPDPLDLSGQRAFRQKKDEDLAM